MLEEELQFLIWLEGEKRGDEERRRGGRAPHSGPTILDPSNQGG